MKHLTFFGIGVIFLAAHTSVQAADSANDVTVTLGVKAWDNKWTSWDAFPALDLGNSSLPGSTENYTSGSKLALIPTASVRFGNWLVSGSQFVNKSYRFTGQDGNSFGAKRSETDIHAGYYVLPTLAITLGYKDVKQDFGTNADFKYSGPIIGASASAPLTQGFSLYGNFGYGRMDAKLPSGAADASGSNNLKANYLLGEVGIAYSFDVRSALPAAKAVTLTLGYRSQVLDTKAYRVALTTVANGPTRSAELRDTTEGLALGLSASF